MATELATKYLQYVDEEFTTESKTSLVTNKDFAFDGAGTVKIYKISTGTMNDYGRTGPSAGEISRYGSVESLDATTETFTLRKDRSFTFVIDTLDMDETGQALEAASALARQIRQVVIPEVDTYTLNEMCQGAGTKPVATALTSDNIYDLILEGSAAMDNAEVPEIGRVLLVTPDTYRLLKQNPEVSMDGSEIGAAQRVQGVIAMLDGMTVLRVPAPRLPSDFGFMIVHPCATVTPMKLENYRVHQDPPGISGSLVEGRVVYDAFVLENKAKAIYYQATAEAAGE